MYKSCRNVTLINWKSIKGNIINLVKVTFIIDLESIERKIIHPLVDFHVRKD